MRRSADAPAQAAARLQHAAHEVVVYQRRYLVERQGGAARREGRSRRTRRARPRRLLQRVARRVAGGEGAVHGPRARGAPSVAAASVVCPKIRVDDYICRCSTWPAVGACSRAKCRSTTLPSLRPSRCHPLAISIPRLNHCQLLSLPIDSPIPAEPHPGVSMSDAHRLPGVGPCDVGRSRKFEARTRGRLRSSAT